MKIWIIKTGEPVPYLPAERNDRFMRAGQMVRQLHEAGHDVTWWAGQFDHMAKRHRPDQSGTVLRHVDGPDVILLPSPGYKSHMGLARVMDHRRLAGAFMQIAPTQPQPDIIVCAYPTIDLAKAATEFGAQHNIPTVVDIRDLWPDIFEERLRQKLPFINPSMARCIFAPYRRMAVKALLRATSLTSLTRGMLEWAQDTAGRTNQQRRCDYVNYQCKPQPVISPLPVDNALRRYMETRLLAPDGLPKIRLVWAGSIINNTDAATLIDALANQPSRVQDYLDFVICGRGPLGPDCAQLAKTHDNIAYFEWLESNELNILLESSHIGLMCYLDRLDFQMSIPNKVVDYFAASLRILTNLDGEVRRLAGHSDALIPYKTGNRASLTAAFEAIATQPDYYRNKPEHIRQLYELNFNSVQVLPAYEAHLTQLHKRQLATSSLMASL